jgi:hypothetical protein
VWPFVGSGEASTCLNVRQRLKADNADNLENLTMMTAELETEECYRLEEMR